MEEQPQTAQEKPTKKPGKAKKVFGILVFVLGTLTLIAGVVWLVLDLIKKPIIRDADYLVSVGTWQLKDSSEVVWNFTEVGKGTLTTNFHINDYDFRWRMDGDTLIIETDWLYTLDDEYTYELDQNKDTLTLTSGENTYTFVPAEYVEDEEPEDEIPEETPEETEVESN